MNLIGICQAVLLLFIANSAPVLVKNVLGNRFDAPLDCGRLWIDGQQIFGASKTLRGLIAGVAACALGGAVMGLPIGVGAAVGAAAMAGDLLSSFLKRRLQIAPSGRAVALDQIPEALLPALVLASPLQLSIADIIIVTLAFWGAGVALSPLLHRLGLRDRPH